MIELSIRRGDEAFVVRLFKARHTEGMVHMESKDSELERIAEAIEKAIRDAIGWKEIE